MSKNPIINAALASLYIVLVACLMFYGMEKSMPSNSVIVPIAVLSLFCLSAAVMGYLFGSKPIQMFLDGKKKEAVSLFLQTLAAFGALTLIFFGVLFSGILK